MRAGLRRCHRRRARAHLRPLLASDARTTTLLPAPLPCAEFAANGLAPFVTVTQRDIEGAGFPEALHGRADALFLDLPKPYKARPLPARWAGARGAARLRAAEQQSPTCVPARPCLAFRLPPASVADGRACCPS